MKKYENPRIEITTLAVEDYITISGFSPANFNSLYILEEHEINAMHL